MNKLFHFTIRQNAPLSMQAWVLVFATLFFIKTNLAAQNWIRTFNTQIPVASSIPPITFGDSLIIHTNESLISFTNSLGQQIGTIQEQQLINTTVKIFGLSKSMDNQNIIIAKVQYATISATAQTLTISKYQTNQQQVGNTITVNLPPTRYFQPKFVKLHDGYLISDGITGLNIKIDELGTVLWTSNIGTSWASDRAPIVLANKNILKFGLKNDSINNRTKVTFVEISPNNGQVIDSADVSIPKLKGTYAQVVATRDSGIVLLRKTKSNFSEQQIVASKIDLRRRYLQNQSFSSVKDTFYANNFQVTTDNFGNIYVAGTSTIANFLNLDQVYLFAFTPDGTYRDSRFYKNFMPNLDDNNLLSLNNLAVTPSGSLYLGGSATRENFLIRLDSFGSRFYEATGRVFRDNNQNCQFDADDTPLSNWLVQAIGKRSGQRFFQTSDSLGNVNFGTLPVDTYRISAITTNLLWRNCFESTVFFDRTRDTSFGTLVVQPLTDCAVMQTDVATPFLRRCFENTVYVSYRNIGSIAAQNARITVKLDSLMEYISASRPLSSRIGNLLTFELGDVPEAIFNHFNITARIKCGDSTRLGQTLCVEARAYPDTFCIPTSPNWSGATIAVAGSCQNDSIHFYIRNIGRAATATGIRYSVIEDDIVFMQGITPILSPNASKLIRLPATGKTYRVIADQEVNHPLSESQPTTAVEGCRRNGQSFTTGFFNQFAESDASPSIDLECREIVGAYDPNDKTGLPKGYDNQHFIQKNDDIEYMIRFQNTGTDTAFTVIVRDTLPYNQLDPTTVKVGASSHAYTWQMMDKGVLEFRFDNILLPDSFRNQAASNGFVKFRISQKANLVEGAKIENRAGIYFDFNAPIITNRTLHTIATTYKTQLRLDNDEVTAAAKIRIAPNPFGEQTVIELMENTPSVKSSIFELYDLKGKVLRREKFEGNRFVFERNDLPTGIFIFKISTVDGRLIGQGKVVAQ